MTNRIDSKERWSILDAPGGRYFGVFDEGPRDRRSKYRPTLTSNQSKPAVGLQRGEFDLTFDVSNHAVLGSVSTDGLITGMAASSGVLDAYGAGLPGVYVEKEVLFAQGRFGVQVAVGEWSPADIRADLIDNLIPRSRLRIGPLDITRVNFAAVGDIGSRAQGVIAVTRIENRGSETREVALTISCEISHAVGMARVEPIFFEGPTEEDFSVPFNLRPGEARVVVVGFELLGADDEPDPSFSTLRPEAELVQTLSSLRQSYGTLAIEGAPYYTELLERQAELARQVMLYDRRGEHAGSFLGSDANGVPNVWMLDLYYSMLPMASLNPRLARDTVDFFVKYGLPPMAWGNYAAMDSGRPLEMFSGITHSVSNATSAIALAGAYIDATGDVHSLQHDSAFMEYARRVVALLISSRRNGEVLFRSAFISDGPSRGDFNTGTNIKVWYALVSLVSVLEGIPGAEAERLELLSVAEELKTQILSRCVVEGPFGDEYVEGIWADGTFVAGHDGEGSDLTLASFYGFTTAADPRLIRHAVSAFSTLNPYFTPDTGGVSWWDFDFCGPTFPAYVHRLCAVGNESETPALLDQIRQRADLDGSTWWWPHYHEDTDPADVVRRPAKCGWSAGVFVTKFVRDILGLKVESQGSRLVFAPFIPWGGFTWEDLSLGSVKADVSFQRNDDYLFASVFNRSDREITARLELVIPDSMSATTLELDGLAARESVRWTARNGRRAAVIESPLPAGSQTSLTIGLRQTRYAQS